MIDLHEVKSVSCTEYMVQKGFVKDKKSNSRYSFFLSPFKIERSASFCVNESRNTWFDYSSGFGGDVIKLVMLVEHLEFMEAVEKLSNSTFCKVPVKNERKSDFEIIDVKPISNNNLVNYLRFERKINIELAKEFVHEVHFQNKQKKQYAIGFKNDKGGFELRNKFLKIATSPKWITTIPGTDTKNIFEGFMDFLSAITYFNCMPKETIIVLNSVSLIEKVDLAGKIKFWGDNDNAGNECFNKLNAIDERALFSGYKDFNEFLCAVGPKHKKAV